MPVRKAIGRREPGTVPFRSFLKCSSVRRSCSKTSRKSADDALEPPPHCSMMDGWMEE